VRFLLDQMFPPGRCRAPPDDLGHDAVHVAEVGLSAADDADIAAVARHERRAVVTRERRPLRR
jgi:predicted nuclease of predicted toxin-antitoxin system